MMPQCLVDALADRITITGGFTLRAWCWLGRMTEDDRASGHPSCRCAPIRFPTSTAAYIARPGWRTRASVDSLAVAAVPLPQVGD